MTVCLPGAKIEDVTERVGQVMGNGHGGSILVHVSILVPDYVMFRKYRQERMGGGVIVYIKESIQAYELQIERSQTGNQF